MFCRYRISIRLFAGSRVSKNYQQNKTKKAVGHHRHRSHCYRRRRRRLRRCRVKYTSLSVERVRKNS